MKVWKTFLSLDIVCVSVYN